MFRILARSWVIKDLWESSLNSRLLSVLLSSLVMVTTATLRKHTLFFGDGRVIDKEVVSIVLLFVCSIVLVGWTDCSEGWHYVIHWYISLYGVCAGSCGNNV